MGRDPSWREEDIVPSSDLTGGDVPTPQLYAQAYLQMYDSQNDAKGGRDARACIWT